ncbi:MAG TPA: hypothetical protein VLY04_03465 [Bryobacteraceae bacterium]|nr:hypothetical protein [Bryobacteraceae bacterium]
MKKTTWLAIGFGILVLGYLVTSSFHTQPFRCQVCITFKGRSDCRTGAAQTREEALRTATMTTCAQLSSGVTESNQCENTPPDSVSWLSETRR